MKHYITKVEVKQVDCSAEQAENSSPEVVLALWENGVTVSSNMCSGHEYYVAAQFNPYELMLVLEAASVSLQQNHDMFAAGSSDSTVIRLKEKLRALMTQELYYRDFYEEWQQQYT